MEVSKTAPTQISIKVELFGIARLASGRRQVEVQIPGAVAPADIVAALAEVCPELIGRAIREDMSGLMESYVFNLNGTEFVSGESLSLKHGDRLLLFSSQAGG